MIRIARTPQQLLLCMMFLMSFGFATWMVLLNNFVVERAQFTGVEIGILQSVREIPGFLAFTAVFVLLLIREQSFALLALATMFIGILLTGFFPNATGLYFTTVIMSVGFHYFETINKSLTLQWLDKKDAPEFMGQALSVKAIASLLAYGLIWVVMGQFGVDYVWLYALVGGLGVFATLIVATYFKHFDQHATQHKKLILRQRYWLYYALVFLSGARRQIFVVFAGFMMVEQFGYSVSQISTLFIANYVFNFLFAKKIGAFIGRIGERKALLIEYVGLIMVFGGYALVDNANMAAALYIIDHLFFAFAIAINTYFQKIADPRDIAASASVSFTINHIAAVVIPALLGIVWIYSHAAVFMIGVGFAIGSLILAYCIPAKPEPGNELLWSAPKQAQQEN
ncbi:MFS transporter [Neiella marina]|uniref:MFS transporter n=1 Tax=Neiella holothuriorum TaxID=2870530 RepID=A0ABS7EI00_9GAMM|nr:MFS transporter [Neiella holothuriorum]MBW8191864.1 MFS transporter [Neiella holothuriorum]